MLIACWSVKGGSGTTVVATSLALVLSREDPGALLVDLGGDVPAALGMPEPSGPGVADWLAAGPDVPADGLARVELEALPGLGVLPRGTGRLGPAERVEVLASLLATDTRHVVVDAGRVDAPAASDAAHEAALIFAASATRSLLVTRPCYLSLRRAVSSPVHPSAAVVVTEAGRALDATDVEAVLGVEVLAAIRTDPAVARAVDAGLLAARLPRGLVRALRGAA